MFKGSILVVGLFGLLFVKTATRRRTCRCHDAAGLWKDVFQISCEPLMDVCLELLVHAVGVVNTLLSGVAAAAALAGRRATLCPGSPGFTGQQHLAELRRWSARRVIGSSAMTRIVHVGRWWSVRCGVDGWRCIWIPCGPIRPRFVAVSTRSWWGSCRSAVVGMLWLLLWLLLLWLLLLLLLSVVFGRGSGAIQVIKHALNSFIFHFICLYCANQIVSYWFSKSYGEVYLYYRVMIWIDLERPEVVCQKQTEKLLENLLRQCLFVLRHSWDDRSLPPRSLRLFHSKNRQFLNPFLHLGIQKEFWRKRTMKNVIQFKLTFTKRKINYWVEFKKDKLVSGK